VLVLLERNEMALFAQNIKDRKQRRLTMDNPIMLEHTTEPVMSVARIIDQLSEIGDTNYKSSDPIKTLMKI